MPSPLLQTKLSSADSGTSGSGQAGIGFWPQVVFKNCLPSSIEVAVIRAATDDTQQVTPPSIIHVMPLRVRQNISYSLAVLSGMTVS
jgi:hypothetical protein